MPDKSQQPSADQRATVFEAANFTLKELFIGMAVLGMHEVIA